MPEAKLSATYSPANNSPATVAKTVVDTSLDKLDYVENGNSCSLQRLSLDDAFY